MSAQQSNPTPSAEEMIQEILRGNQVIVRNQQILEQRIAEAEKARASLPTPAPKSPDPGDKERVRERFFADFAEDPIEAFRKTKELAKKEAAEELRQEFDVRLKQTAQDLEARNYARTVMNQNPDLQGFEDKLSGYMDHLNQHPEARHWTNEQRINQAVQWTRDWKWETARRVEEEKKYVERQMRGQASPVPGAYRDGPQSAAQFKTDEEMRRERYELMQGNVAKRRGSLYNAA